MAGWRLFDGKDIAVGDTDTAEVYLTSGKKGKIAGHGYVKRCQLRRSILDRSGNQGKTNAVLVAPSQDGDVVGFYAYPAGTSSGETDNRV